MFEFVVSTDISHFWFGKLVDKLPVSVTIHGMISNDEGVVHYLIEVKLNAVSLSVLHQIIDDIDGIAVVNTSDITNNRVILTVSVDECDICQAILKSGCFLKSAWTKNDRIIWRFVSPRKESVRKIAESLTELKIDFSLAKLQALDDKGVLSQKQEEIIKIAVEKGYYDFPKRIGVREISKEVNISSATVSETLRRATKKLILKYLYDEDPKEI